MKKLDIPTKTELKENEFFHLHKGILLLAKALKISKDDYKSTMHPRCHIYMSSLNCQGKSIYFIEHSNNSKLDRKLR